MSAGAGTFKQRKLTINSPKSATGLAIPLKVMNINIVSDDDLYQEPMTTKNANSNLLLNQKRSDFALMTSESGVSTAHLRKRKISVNDLVTHKYPGSRVISPNAGGGFRRRNISNALMSNTNMKSGPLTCTSIGEQIKERNTDMSSFSTIRPKSSITQSKKQWV